MRNIKCYYCKREIEVENNTIIYVCKCGESIEIREDENKQC